MGSTVSLQRGPEEKRGKINPKAMIAMYGGVNRR